MGATGINLHATRVFAIAGQDVVSFGFGSLLYRISWLDVIYLAFDFILYISFSIGICFGGRNRKPLPSQIPVR